MRSDWGTVSLDVQAPGPCEVVVVVRDERGRILLRRRLPGRRVMLPLPAGGHRVLVDDSRPVHDPRRFTGAAVDVEVVAGTETVAVAGLGASGVVRVGVLDEGRPVRFARVSVRDDDGDHFDLRADGRGDVVLAGLRAGGWWIDGADGPRRRAARPVRVLAAAGREQRATLELDQPTARLLVSLRGASSRPLCVTTLTLTHVESGRTVTGQVRGGLAAVRGLLPGRHELTVPASLGHLATTVDAGVLAPGGLAVCDVVVPVGALLTGRVVQGLRPRGQHAAVVTLVDAEGRELERVRTDRSGRYEIGCGLAGDGDLTVVATSGPETVHVTRAAQAELTARAGVRYDLGELHLPVAGRRAAWAPGPRSRQAMKLPSTRV